MTENRPKRFSPLHWLAAGCVLVACVAIGFIWSRPVEVNTIAWSNTDFSNYWTASTLLLKGRVMDLFSGQETYFANLQAIFGPDYPWRNWSYPPSYVLLMWPLGFAQLASSLVIFQLVTALFFLHAVSTVQRDITPGAAALLIAFLICNTVTAQNGFLTAALMLYGLSLRDRNPIVAGIAFGLLTVKPQLGLLVPLLLLYERRWTVIVAAGLSSLALVAASGTLLGWETWAGYIRHNVPYQSYVMTDMGGIFLRMMPSLFGTLRFMEMPSSPAMIIHSVLAIAGFAGFLVGLVRARSLFERSLVLLLASFLVAPYSLVYDLGALSAVAAIAAFEQRSDEQSTWWRPTFILVALLPLIHFAFLGLSHVPVAPLVLSCALLLIVTRPRNQTQAV